MLLSCVREWVVRASAVVASLVCSTASFGQLPLPPGATVTPPAVDAAGTVIYDPLIPFEIRGVTGALLYKGNLQDRVLRDASSNLIFLQKVREIQAGLNGIIARIDRVSFEGATCEVSFATSLGTVGPSLASRSSGAGHDVRFSYSPGVFSSAGSTRFNNIFTRSRSFNVRGLTTITLTTGESVVLSTAQPGVAAPVAEITSPSAFGCVCNPASIRGTAAAGGDLDSWTLDYSTNPAGPYTTIVTSSVPVVNGVLATWNTAALPQGYYFLRLVVTNTAGETATAFTVVFVDSGFDNLTLRSPVSNGVYGGVVCFDGTVTDQCFRDYTISFRPGEAGPFTTIVNSVTPVINDPLGSWNAGGQPDGSYQVQVVGRDQCGNSATVTRSVVIDNTPPTAQILRPVQCDSVRGLVAVFGTALDRHMGGWVLEYTGGPSVGWTTIATGNTNVVNGVLGIWDTRDLPVCCYTIRLRVTDAVSVNCDGSHYSEALVSLDVADPTCGADFNMDGGVDGADVQAFFEVWENGGCLR